MVDAGDRFAVLESTSHGLALERVAEVAYDVAVLTNITHEHLDLHGTMEAYVGAKRSLFERLAVGPTNPDKGWPKSAVVNADDAARGGFVACRARRRGAGADLRGRSGRSGRRHGRDGARRRRRPAAARPHGALGGRARAAAGRPLQRVQHARGGRRRRGTWSGPGRDAPRPGVGSTSVPGRLIRVDEGQEFTVYVDFAHTPGALAAALDSLAPHAAARGGGLISVFGSPGARDTLKRPMMGRAAGERSRVVVLADDDPRDEDRMGILEQIAVGAIEAGRRRDQDLFLIPDRARRSARRSSMARPGDIVLLAGMGHVDRIMTAEGRIPYSEEQVARETLPRDGLPPLSYWAE